MFWEDSRRFEAKAKDSELKNNISQLVAMNITSAFIEKNRHPSKVSLIPCVLIGPTKFTVSFFDSESDVLLLSQSIT